MKKIPFIHRSFSVGGFIHRSFSVGGFIHRSFSVGGFIRQNFSVAGFIRRSFSAGGLISIICLLTSYPPAFAQSGLWTFMHGDSTIGSPGIFGIQGVSDPANNPPSMYEPCEWTDHEGNFWMLGGDSYNCLWKFSPVTNEWTWMHGSTTTGQTGLYGVQGVPSPSNHPGGRQAATTWVDNDGALWLFSGYGYPSSGFLSGLSDLWKYDVATNEWTWMDGPNTGNGLGVYGTQGVPDPANVPGARLETAAAWVDSANNLWFFGGQLCCSTSGFIDDVWMYNTSTGEWTWMKGSTVGYAAPVHGNMGIADPSNTPGGRRIYSHWRDENYNFWIFGGQDNSSNCFNDLWKYDPSLNEWTWMKGANVVNAPGSFGTQCSFDSTNNPAARMENRFYWTDSCFNFWMFGGLNTNNGNYRNDLWCYNPLLNQWKWVSGSNGANQDGNYGTLGVPAAGNRPGARYGGVAWIGPAESLWLYGGVGYPHNNNVGSLNDLWRFVPDSSCVYCNILNLPVSALQTSDTSLCEKFCIDFLDVSSNDPASWQWEFPGGIPSSSTDQNPTNICYDNPGTYDVTLISSNSFGSDTLTLTDFITVYPTPPFPIITQTGYTLTSSPAPFYQWQFNSVDIAGATNQSYTVTQTGYYTVLVSDSSGCKNSSTLYVLITAVEELSGQFDFSIYPNPSNGSFIVELFNGSISEKITIEIRNTLGQVVFFSEEKILSNDFRKVFEFNNKPIGIYFVIVRSGGGVITQKMVIAE